MTHQETASGWKSYDAIYCKAARKSLRYCKRKSHKKLRQIRKKEIE